MPVYPTIEACSQLAAVDPLTVAYIGAGAALVGATLGFAGPQLVAWSQKRKRHRAYWSAMSAEVDLCREDAEVYVRDMVIAPLYRLSTIAYANGFPGLLGDGAVSGDEAKAVLSFYSLVDQINRGLEQANDALVDGKKTDKAIAESLRLDEKCKRLVAEGGPYDAVRAVIDAHIKRSRRLLAL